MNIHYSDSAPYCYENASSTSKFMYLDDLVNRIQELEKQVEELEERIQKLEEKQK